MKLDFSGVWGITSEHLKVLETAEKLSTDREYMSVSILKRKTNVKADFNELAMDLVNLKFLTYRDNKYKLSISGHDCLAINALRRSGLEAMGSNIGIGKESDVYLGVFKKKNVAIKIFRLGRTSFQKVEERCLKKDENWLELNRESCRCEVRFLQLFEELNVPRLMGYNRHVLVMKMYNYNMLYQIKIDNCEVISQKIFDFIYNIWQKGYVHGDLNEFNIMINGDKILVLDFPQCIKNTDRRAAEYLKRDIECIHKYFWKKNFYSCDHSVLNNIIEDLQIEISRK